ncbi:MAG: hypothetical protein M1823_003209 [Watsoniomyces obsoletus]|nr:MAG: hypothetical protein M1823_003209 [Watsoniomyces obsoletus]
MGSTSSKAARGAARKYPTRIPPTSQRPSITESGSVKTPGHGKLPADPVAPKGREQSQAHDRRDEAINLDGSDPHYAASLRSLGAVQPNTMYSTSATFNPGTGTSRTQGGIFPDPNKNPAVQVLLARERLAAEAEKEFAEAGKADQQARQFLDIGTIRKVLMLRDDKKLSAKEIERQFGLKEGVVERLGPGGMVAAIRTEIGPR